MIIGIIGGAGVAATNKLCELLEIKYTQTGAFRDGHHPEMIIYQATKAPSRSMYLEGKGESFIQDYIDIGNKLKRSGASTIFMCCNTAHYAIDEIQDKVQIPFVNIIDEVVSKIIHGGKLKVGIIASDGCLGGKVYEKSFSKLMPEAQLIYPDLELQRDVTLGICNIKNTNRFLDDNNPNRPANIFKKVVEQLMNQGAEVVITGCTDIRVDYIPPVDVIDSLDTMVDKIYSITYNR